MLFVNSVFKSWQLIRKQTNKPKTRNACAGHLACGRPWPRAAGAGCLSSHTGVADPLVGTALMDSLPVILRCHPQLRTVAGSTCRGGVKNLRHIT